MPLSFEEEIARHAQQEEPRECCGLLVRSPRGYLSVRKANNIADEPERFFQIPTADYLSAKAEGEVVGYYHSHVLEGPEPSDADRHAAQAAQLPLYIHSLRDGTLGVHVPDGFRAELEGRRFVPMVFDCVSLVWDYLRDRRGIELPLLPRTRRSYFHGADIDWRPWLDEFGGQIIRGTPQEGDVLVMIVNHAAKPNHLGIFLGDGHFLHQPGQAPSRREVWVGEWQRATAFVVRFPDKTA